MVLPCSLPVLYGNGVHACRLYPTHIPLNSFQKGAVAVLSAVGAALRYDLYLADEPRLLATTCLLQRWQSGVRQQADVTLMVCTGRNEQTLLQQSGKPQVCSHCCLQWCRCCHNADKACFCTTRHA